MRFMFTSCHYGSINGKFINFGLVFCLALLQIIKEKKGKIRIYFNGKANGAGSTGNISGII